METKNPRYKYIEDTLLVSMCFDLYIYTPAEVKGFEIFINKTKVSATQEKQNLHISFVEKFPRTLVDDIAWGRNNSEQYVYGFIHDKLRTVNREIVKQKYSCGNFLLKKLSIFDVNIIRLTNNDEKPTDEVIQIPWPPIVQLPEHTGFTKEFDFSKIEVFMKDYIDACNDYLEGDYDECVRKIITVVENMFIHYNIKPRRHIVTKILNIFRYRGLKFNEQLDSLWPNSKFIGYTVVKDNLRFVYKIRNKIVHEHLRIQNTNGEWFCGKALDSLQYFCQFIDGIGEGSRGAYIFRVNCFFNDIVRNIIGSSLENDRKSKDILENTSPEDLIIKDDNDMNNWKFGNIKITDEEKKYILNNKIKPVWY